MAGSGESGSLQFAFLDHGQGGVLDHVFLAAHHAASSQLDQNLSRIDPVALRRRFGVATEQSLIKAYQQTWITTSDLDNVKNAGYNVKAVGTGGAALNAIVLT